MGVNSALQSVRDVLQYIETSSVPEAIDSPPGSKCDDISAQDQRLQLIQQHQCINHSTCVCVEGECHCILSVQATKRASTIPEPKYFEAEGENVSCWALACVRGLGVNLDLERQQCNAVRGLTVRL